LALTPAMLQHLQTPAAGPKMSRGEFTRLARAVGRLRVHCDGDAASLAAALASSPSAASVAHAREWLSKETTAAGVAAAALDGLEASAVAHVLLDGLRALDDPLLTNKLREAFAAAVNIQDYKSRLYVLRLLLERLPEPNLKLVKDLVGLLGAVAGEHTSAMEAKRLTPMLAALGPLVLHGDSRGEQEASAAAAVRMPLALSAPAEFHATPTFAWSVGEVLGSNPR
jgi:hypothetical protein